MGADGSIEATIRSRTPESRIAASSRLPVGGSYTPSGISTGKTPVSATPAAAATMLREIAGSGLGNAGFKASGGIRSVVDARAYLQLAADALGAAALTPQRLRFGASGLLGDIEAVLAGQDSAAVSAAY